MTTSYLSPISLEPVRALAGFKQSRGSYYLERQILTPPMIRTAQHYVKKHNDDDDEERRLPCRHRKTKVGNGDKLIASLSPFLRLY